MKKPLKDSPNVGYLIYSSTYFYRCQQTNVVSLSAEVGLRYSNCFISLCFLWSLVIIYFQLQRIENKTTNLYFGQKHKSSQKIFSIKHGGHTLLCFEWI